jgi:predicted nucleotidyltransferase
MQNKYNLKYIKENNLILLEAISGSIAYGLNLPTSDTDIRGIYICEQEDLFSDNYPSQLTSSND